jgi:hypothetical protein
MTPLGRRVILGPKSEGKMRHRCVMEAPRIRAPQVNKDRKSTKHS